MKKKVYQIQKSMFIKSKLITVLIIASKVFGACSPEDSNPEFVDQPVVEAYLKNGDTINVKISRELPFASNYDTSNDDINALDIVVSHNDKIYKLTPIGTGKYTNASLTVKEGEYYYLKFVFNGKIVTATTTIPSKPVNFQQSKTSIVVEQPSAGHPPSSMPDPVTLTWNNPDGSYYLVVAENVEANPTSIREFDTGSPPPNIFRNQPIQDNKYDVQSRDFSYYGTYRLVLFHLNPDYAALYDAKGTSSQNLTNPSTGITNGIGIFTGINSDTLWLEVLKD
jgi:hypothetical protein